ncbi:MAG: hypothetical protein MZW92_07915 [Comamonadaceae bacterium]|nr:hypothetical protein [Comamonadaceae bacterium]
MAPTDPMPPSCRWCLSSLHSARSAVLVMALSGCAAIAPLQPVHYRCDDGREFSVIYRPAGRSARIDIAGMRFELEPEQTKEGGERYGCGVLTLWRDGRGRGWRWRGRGCTPTAVRGPDRRRTGVRLRKGLARMAGTAGQRPPDAGR